ncbi:MAG: hypothetical protein WC501_05545 [Candidatus Micrarchaeia archaeon]|jgi:nucleolar protein 56
MKKREKFLKKTREKIVQALSGRDIFLSKYSSTVEELDQIINILGERLEDMFNLYCGDLEVREKEKYAKIVLLSDKTQIDQKELSKIFGSAKSNQILNKLRLENIKQEDLDQCKIFAQEILKLCTLREESEKNIEIICEDVCPNMAYVCSAKIAAKLISHVGGLQDLALLPASTIQVLGAEKALFKHLKNKRIKPPKHGIIFQYPKIANSPKKIRGKISRTLAAKIASAAKADAFTKRFIAENLKKEFDERVEKLLNQPKSDR